MVFDADECKPVIPGDLHRVAESPRRRHIIVSRSNSPSLVGASALVPKDYPELFLSDKLWQIKFHAERLTSPEWLAQLLASPLVRYRLSQLATGTSNSMKNISKDDFLSLTILIPPLPVQERIAEAFTLWDRAISSAERLIAAKQKLRKGLMHQLLTGNRRFPGFSEPWREVALGEVTTESSRRNNGELDRTTVRAVTNSVGMIPMREQTIAESLGRYKIIEPRAFAYNPMRINVGSLCMWTGDSPALVSPDYVVFACNEGQLDANYFDYLRQTHRWAHYMTAGGNGSVRIRIYYADLAGLRFVIPPYPEQVRIGRFLGNMDRELDLLRAQLAALKTQKRGLMQQLLTGKVRVPLPAPTPQDQAAAVVA